MTTTSEIRAAQIDAVADHIETYGWTKRQTYKVPDTITVGYDEYIKIAPSCILGALAVVVPNIEIYPVRCLLSNALIAEGNTGHVPDFNDAKGRTKRQVLAFLRRTARKLRKG